MESEKEKLTETIIEPLPPEISQTGHREMLTRNKQFDGTGSSEGSTDGTVFAYPKISPSPVNRDRRIILLGMSGSGKSSSGNSIVGQKAFKASASGSTETFNCEHAFSTVEDRNILIVDTPGLFDTTPSDEKTMKEISRCVALSAPGPHALILVVEGGTRTSEQTQRCAKIILEVFGDQAIGHMVILFTRLDDILYYYYEKNIDDIVENLPPNMKEVLSKCGNRYVAFNNRETSAEANKEQVDKLLTLVDKVVDLNGGHYFTNDVYKNVEETMATRENKLKEKYEKERKKELQKIKERFEEELRETTKKLGPDQIEKERKRLEADTHNHYDKKVQYVRMEVCDEVQNDRDGSGDLFNERMQIIAKMTEKERYCMPSAVIVSSASDMLSTTRDVFLSFVRIIFGNYW